MNDATAQPLVSVVIPTLRRPDLLQRCLTAVLDQDFPAALFEILVCDDGPDDASRQCVQQLARSWPAGPALRYLPAVGQRGPAAARNRGWRSARGQIIAFTDDDTIPARDWLAQGMLAMAPDVGAISGRITMPVPHPPSDYERDAAGLAHAEFATANCFVRIDALRRVGGFDTRFTMAWREDSDLHFSLISHGFLIKQAPKACVLHPVRPVRFAAGLRMQRKVMYDTLLLAKHPLLYRKRIRSGPPWFYLTVTLSALLALMTALAGHWALAAAATLAWALMTMAFFGQRLRGTRRGWRELADLALTSALVPLLSIGWRVVGMLRFGPRFP